MMYNYAHIIHLYQIGFAGFALFAVVVYVGVFYWINKKYNAAIAERDISWSNIVQSREKDYQSLLADASKAISMVEAKLR